MQLLQEKCHASNKHWISVLMIDVDYFKQFNDQYVDPITTNACAQLRIVSSTVFAAILIPLLVMVVKRFWLF